MMRVFFVTGCSTGFGKALVQILLDQGEQVVATARDPSSLKFDNADPDKFLPLKLDVTSDSKIETAFDLALAKFHRIDVVVNNAGYALAGPLETISQSQIQAQFDTNVFSVIQITRQAIQIMHRQHPPGGLIQQITSLAGQHGSPMLSIYGASKWAVEGFTEAVSKEVKPEWNIRFTCIEPGPFRTDGFGRSLAIGELPNEYYDHLDARQEIGGIDGKQPGDTVKGAKAMYQLACMEDPPLRCALGKVAHEVIQQKIKTYQELYSRPDIVELVTNVEVD